jgi:hypothetical protein
LASRSFIQPFFEDIHHRLHFLKLGVHAGHRPFVEASDLAIISSFRCSWSAFISFRLALFWHLSFLWRLPDIPLFVPFL